MNKATQNNSYFIAGFLAVLAGILYCFDSSLFDSEEESKRKNLKDRDADFLKSDLESIHQDFQKSRNKVFKQYGIQ